MSTLASLRKETMELLRNGHLLVLAAVLLVFGGLMSPLITKYGPQIFSQLMPQGEQLANILPPPTLLEAVAQYVKNTNQFSIILALLLTMGVVAQEKERGTAALMLVKPVSRMAFLWSKFLALALAFLACLVLAGAGAYLYTAVLFEAPDLVAWIVMTLLIWVETLVYLALMLLFSTLMRSQAAAIGLGFVALLLLNALGGLPRLAAYLPGRLMVWSASLFTPQPMPAWAALWTSLGIIVAALLAAWAVFAKQEL